MITTHFARRKSLILEHSLDASRIWNLEESGVTPDRNLIGSIEARRIMLRHGDGDLKLPEFARSERVTRIAVVSAAGNSGPPIFVFKGVHLSYRRVDINV